MEDCVDKLQNAFRLAELNVDYLEKKVNTEFVNATADSQAETSQENPSQLLDRLDEVKKDYADVLKDVDEIKKMQWEAVQVFRQELMTAVQSLQALQAKTGITPPADLAIDDDVNEVSELMNIPDIKSTNIVSETSSEQPAGSTTKPPQQKFEQINESPYTKRKNQTEFMEISEDEFNTVSTLVRGRVKLGDVNRTYKLLWDHFKEQGNTASLSPSDMDAMSLRVSGITGEAKLNVLRSLRLLQISKRGEVNLL